MLLGSLLRTDITHRAIRISAVIYVLVGTVAGLSQPTSATAIFSSVPNGDFAATKIGYPSTAWMAGGAFLNDVQAVGTPTGQTCATARDYWNAIWLNCFSDQSLSWSGWKFAGGATMGTPTIAVGTDGIFYIVVRDAWKHMWVVTYNGSAFQWTAIDGIFDSDPGVCVDVANNVVIAARDTTGGPNGAGGFWLGRYHSQSGFSGWFYTGGVGIGKPTLACGTDSAIYFSLRDPDGYPWMGRAYHAYAVQGPYLWHKNQSGPVYSDLSISRIASVLNVAAIGTGNTVQISRFFQGEDNTWTSWQDTGVVLNAFSLSAWDGLVYISGRSNQTIWWYQENTTWNGGVWNAFNLPALAQGSVSAAPGAAPQVPPSNCPATLSQPFYWVWSQLYIKNSSSLPNQVVQAAAASWSSVSSLIQFNVLSNPPFMDIEIQNAQLLNENGEPYPGEARLRVQQPASSGGCLNSRDTCGRCMTSSTAYYAVIYVNPTFINTLAFQTLAPVADAQRQIVAHELGHVLHLDHSREEALCPYMQSIMNPSAGPMLRCRVFAPRSPCDSTTVIQDYASAGFIPFQHCACAIPLMSCNY